MPGAGAVHHIKAEVELGSKRLIAGRFSSTIKFKINAIEVSRFDQ
jgi:hypothetical protein